MKHKIRLPETPKVPIHKNIIPSFFNMLAPFSMMLLFLFLYFSFFKLKTKPNTPNNIIPIGNCNRNNNINQVYLSAIYKIVRIIRVNPKCYFVPSGTGSVFWSVIVNVIFLLSTVYSPICLYLRTDSPSPVVVQ